MESQSAFGSDALQDPKTVRIRCPHPLLKMTCHWRLEILQPQTQVHRLLTRLRKLLPLNSSKIPV